MMGVTGALHQTRISCDPAAHQAKPLPIGAARIDPQVISLHIRLPCSRRRLIIGV